MFRGDCEETSRGLALMTKFEAFRRVATEIGEATSEEIAAYIEGRFGIEITPQYIPLFRATLQFQQCRPGSATANNLVSLPQAAP